jgi:uncharacterized protein YegL
MLSFTSEFLTRTINTKETGLITLEVPDNITINDYNRHTILVLDISASMRGQRYSTLLASVEYIFEKSKENDYFSILLFSSSVKLICNKEKLSPINKIQILKMLKNTNPTGGTNINEALQFVNDITKNEDILCNVLLFTDGDPTEGIIRIDKIIDNYTTYYNGNHSLHTFGYGAEHNEKLLTKLSNVCSDGLYYNILDTYDVGNKLGPYLKYYNTIVLMNSKLHIMTDDNIEITNLFTSLNYIKLNEHTYEIDLGALALENIKNIPIEIYVKNKGKINVALTYNNSIKQITHNIEYITHENIYNHSQIKNIRIKKYEYLTAHIIEQILNDNIMYDMINEIADDPFVKDTPEVQSLLKKINDSKNNVKKAYSYISSSRTQRSNDIDSPYVTLSDIASQAESTTYITSASLRYT